MTQLPVRHPYGQPAAVQNTCPVVLSWFCYPVKRLESFKIVNSLAHHYSVDHVEMADSNGDFANAAGLYVIVVAVIRFHE